MKGLLDGLKAIWGFFEMIANVLETAIKSLIELIKLLTSIPTNLGILVGTLPPWLIAVATTTIGVSIIYILLGRETGK